MHLSCPNCHTIFVVPKGAIGAESRPVKCSRCQHLWRASIADLFDASQTTPPQAPPAHDAAVPPPTTATRRGPRLGWIVLSVLIAALLFALFVPINAAHSDHLVADALIGGVPRGAASPCHGFV